MALTMAVLVAVPPALFAQTSQASEGTSTARRDALQLADEYVRGVIRTERLRAGNSFLEKSLRRIESTVSTRPALDDVLPSLRGLDAPTRQAVTQVLEQGTEPVAKGLDREAEELNRQAEQLTATWHSMRSLLNERRFLLFEVNASRRIATQLASLLSVDKRWFWLFGVVAVATLAGVVFHERRHELRRLLNGGRAKTLGLSKVLFVLVLILAGLTLTTFVMGNRIYESLLSVGAGQDASPRQRLVAEAKEVATELAGLEKQRRELQSRYEKALSDRQRQLDTDTAGSRLAAIWSQSQVSALAVVESAAVLERLSQSMEEDLGGLGKLDEELNAQTEATARYLRLRQWIRGGLGLALLGLTLAGGFAFHRGVVARRQRTADTCPLCLGVGHLEAPADRVRSGDGPRDVPPVECRNVISEEPYEECDYRFMEAYRPMTKLCFPTLGVPQAGKTHWLTMMYWELNRGNYPSSVQFEKIKSQTSQDYDMIVEEILTSRIGTAATQRDRIPHPLVFNFQDRDPFGRSNVLVNIFDYSGEVTLDMGVEDYRRRRALDGDGFLFFLDPTYPSEPQAKALADFREDLRLVKGIKAGRRVGVPVALCVSKIDILAARSFDSAHRGDIIGQFYEELSLIDPTGEAMTLKVIEARSRLISRLRDAIWPGWQIERQVHNLFGGRYRFFPLTPVGLDGLGETDLSLRTISPFGLLEPLLWLLEMNGYPVLK
jgi:hypothetical protein